MSLCGLFSTPRRSKAVLKQQTRGLSSLYIPESDQNQPPYPGPLRRSFSVYQTERCSSSAPARAPAPLHHRRSDNDHRLSTPSNVLLDISSKTLLILNKCCGVTSAVALSTCPEKINLAVGYTLEADNTQKGSLPIPQSHIYCLSVEIRALATIWALQTVNSDTAFWTNVFPKKILKKNICMGHQWRQYSWKWLPVCTWEVNLHVNISRVFSKVTSCHLCTHSLYFHTFEMLYACLMRPMLTLGMSLPIYRRVKVNSTVCVVSNVLLK